MFTKQLNRSFMLATILLVALLTTKLSASAEKKPDTKKEGGHTKTPAEVQSDARKAMAITDDYVHSWIAFPSLSGLSIFDQKPLSFKPVKGEILAVFFVASWCLPCQRLAKNMMQIERRYQTLYTKSVFVFTHDIKEDAAGFANEYGIRDNAVLADHKILKDFHNPKIPSVYISDRQTWLSKRYIELDEKALANLDQTLALMTSY